MKRPCVDELHRPKKSIRESPRLKVIAVDCTFNQILDHPDYYVHNLVKDIQELVESEKKAGGSKNLTIAIWAFEHSLCNRKNDTFLGATLKWTNDISTECLTKFFEDFMHPDKFHSSNSWHYYDPPLSAKLCCQGNGRLLATLHLMERELIKIRTMEEGIWSSCHITVLTRLEEERLNSRRGTGPSVPALFEGISANKRIVLFYNIVPYKHHLHNVYIYHQF